MSELPDKESSNTTHEPAPCPRCGKPLAKMFRFRVASFFQTDPGEGLSRWQEYCKCDAEQDSLNDDLLPPSIASEKSSGVDVAPETPDSDALVLPENAQSTESEPDSSVEVTATESHTVDSGKTSDVVKSEEKNSSLDATAEPALAESSPPVAKEGVNQVIKFQVTPSPLVATPLPVQAPVQPELSQSYIIGGRYEVESVIGKGTFGPTYRARDVATGKSLCLKMVSTPISRHRRIVKRIMQEVEKAKTLNHPNIVAIYDSATDKSGRPFYVMDLVEPGSLKKAIKQEGFLDVPEVLEIFLDVCEALTYAHEHGILHRDLKPSNILLSGVGTARRAKVGDFGIIKALPSVGSEAQEMTQSTDVFADPSCMSPEQCLGRRLDVRSDIYSLGCSMYEAILGKKVFSGPNPLSIVVQHFKAAPRPFDTMMYNCDISQDVEAVVLKMLEKSPEHRYQEISQVVEDLRLLKAHRKPTFAYQKKKGGVRNLMLPFGLKEEPESPERLFDIVLNRKQQREEAAEWNDDQRALIAADIKRLERKAPERQQGKRPERRPERQLEQQARGSGIANDAHVADRLLPQRGPGASEISPPPLSYKEAEWAKEASESEVRRGDIIRPGKLRLPSPAVQNELAPASSPARPADFNYVVLPQEEQKINRSLEPLYRASDKYPENLSLFAEDAEEAEPAEVIVTVEQAKREIPDYLLQISRSSGFVTLPMMIALLTVVSIIFITLQIASATH